MTVVDFTTVIADLAAPAAIAIVGWAVKEGIDWLRIHTNIKLDQHMEDQIEHVATHAVGAELNALEKDKVFTADVRDEVLGKALNRVSDTIPHVVAAMGGEQAVTHFVESKLPQPAGAQ